MPLFYLTIRYLRKDPPLRIQIEFLEVRSHVFLDVLDDVDVIDVFSLFSPSALAGRSSRALIDSDTRSASAFTFKNFNSNVLTY